MSYNTLEEFDMDSDELDDQEQLATSDTSRSGEGSEMPLLVGLLHSASRRSTDIPLAPMNGTLGAHHSQETLELIKNTEGSGGMLESIVNMANSILGAGIIGMCIPLLQGSPSSAECIAQACHMPFARLDSSLG